jgi:hypothetical protein
VKRHIPKRHVQHLHAWPTNRPCIGAAGCCCCCCGFVDSPQVVPHACWEVCAPAAAVLVQHWADQDTVT